MTLIETLLESDRPPQPQLGRAIRRAREARQLSQAKLAEAINAPGSQGQVSAWETARVTPEDETVDRIIDALEMSEEEFWSYVDPYLEVTGETRVQWGHEVRKTRETYALDRAQMGELLGVDATLVEQWEKLEAPVPVQTFDALLEITAFGGPDEYRRTKDLRRKTEASRSELGGSLPGHLADIFIDQIERQSFGSLSKRFAITVMDDALSGLIEAGLADQADESAWRAYKRGSGYQRPSDEEILAYHKMFEPEATEQTTPPTKLSDEEHAKEVEGELNPPKNGEEPEGDGTQ